MIHAKEAQLLYDLSINSDLFLIDSLIRNAACNGLKQIKYNVADIASHHRYIDIMLDSGYMVKSSKTEAEITISWE